MLGLSELATKAIAIAALCAAVAFGVHKYNEGLREEGEARISQQWSQASAAMREEWDADRRKLTGEREVLSKQYNAERDTRLNIQAQTDREREDAIRSSSVASLVCIDDRMLGAWNKANGHGGQAGTGAAGRSMAGEVRQDPTKAGR